MPFSELDTRQKALQINLDPAAYGTFAEIGAGQEIGRWFFRVGGAAGTVAKTMSAYDMAVSDAIYGRCSRYVSRERLISMFDHEYDLLVERLGAARGTTTNFFVFADTVSARNFKGTNECHGWMGMRFQTEPGGPPNEIVLHVNMLDKENVLQQEALGIVGVNLMWGAFYDRENLDSLIENLVDDLGPERVEVDIISFSGPAFSNFDPREVGLKLLQLGVANAIIFDTDRQLIRVSEVVHKAPVLIERGAYRARNKLNLTAEAMAKSDFQLRTTNTEVPPVSFVELAIREASQPDEPSRIELLQRIDMLSSLGHRVMVSKFKQFHELTTFLRRYTQEPIAFLMGVGTFARLMNPGFYAGLEGRLLEGIGRLLSHSVTAYVYAMPVDAVRAAIAEDESEDPCTVVPGKENIGIDDILWPDHLSVLIEFLRQSGFVRCLEESAGKAKG